MRIVSLLPSATEMLFALGAGEATVAASAPDVVVSAPCGYGLSDSVRLAERVVAGGRLPPGVPVWAVDANASFARPGPRLVDGVEALAALLHPEAGLPLDARRARRVA